MFGTIVAGYDATDEGRDALALAGLLAGESAERVVAAAVSDDPAWTAPSELGVGDELLLEAAGKVAARSLEEDLVDPAVLEPRGLLATSPAAGLHGLAESLDADLVVVGSSRRGAAGRLLIGSTGSRLLNGAPCPVAAAPRGFAAREHRALRMLGVAYDGSRESAVALEGAGALAADQRAALRLFTAVPSVRHRGHGRSGASAQESRRAQYRAVLDEALEALPAELRPEGQLLTGDVNSELSEQASDALDAMVVGSRGYGPLRTALLGSTASALMRSARCPVIVYPRGIGKEQARAGEGEGTRARREP